MANPVQSYSSLDQFCMDLAAIDLPLCNAAYRLPQQNVVSYEKSASGNFKITYGKSFTSPASHSIESWNAKLKGSTFKVSQVVTGTIDSISKQVTFDEGCIILNYPVFLSSVDIKLKGVSCVEESLAVKAKMGIVNAEIVLGPEVIMGTQLKWA